MKLAVLFGGISSEHDISCLSAASILRNLDKTKYEIYPVGITQEGQWYYCPSATADNVENGAWERLTDKVPALLPPDRGVHGLVLLRSGAAETVRLDGVFPVLHGAGGEDGTIQGLLELAGIPYVGCGVAASANSMDKSITKVLVDAAGVRQAKYYLALRYDFERNAEGVIRTAADRLGSFPVFVKPCSQGSSVGVAKANDMLELAAGLTVSADKVDELRARLRSYAEEHVSMAELVPQQNIDCMVRPEWLTIPNIEALSVLEPYGMRNPEPVFCMKDMVVEDITPISSDRHVRLTLVKDGARFSAMWFGTGAGGLGFVEGNLVDAAFHLEVNEFRGRRSVQLTVCDIQLSECEHLADQKLLNVYNTYMADGPLTAREARLLLPDRKDLVAVWRHIVCRAEDGRLSVPDGALSRRVAWESRRDINIGKLFVCLDVFSESGLISYHFKEGMLNILLKPYEGKADISGSVVLATLQSMAG